MIKHCPSCGTKEFSLGGNGEDEITLNCEKCDSEFIITELKDAPKEDEEVKRAEDTPEDEEEEENNDEEEHEEEPGGFIIENPLFQGIDSGD